MSGVRRVLTFDLWHTLLDDALADERRAARTGLLRAALAAHGIAASLAQVEDAFAACTATLMAARRTDPRDRGPRAQCGQFLRALGADSTPAILDALLVALGEALAGEAPAPYPGVVETLAALAPLAPLGLVCNTGWSGGAALRPVLAHRGILPHISALAFSDEVGWGKPDSRIFRHCLAGLGHRDASTLLHVGDSLPADIAGAKRLGARACWIAEAGADTDAALAACDPLLRPDLVFPSVAAAREMLVQWTRGELFPG